MNKHAFKHQLLAASIASILGVNTYAQQTEETEQQNEVIESREPNSPGVDEEVIVTGIRASLKRSMDLKRDAKGVVDGISAEDIGKFPDTNLAESLQRITGVAIDRTRGEGSEITVRGFGPDFNLVTFNSRQMPTTGGRSFDFSNIASEGVSAVEVYKSGRANVATGGIGAVVNVKTTKPLENPELKAVVSLKGVHDTGTRNGSSLTPEFSGLLSNTFMDDTFGASLSFSYQEREGGTQSTTTQDFYSRNFVTQEMIDEEHEDAEWGSIPVGDPDAIGFPDELVDGIYAIPTNIQYNLDDFERKRTNGQLTLQYAPMDNLTVTLDYTYAQNEIETYHQDLSGWFDPGCRTRESEWVRDGNIWSPVMYRQVGCSQDNLQGVGSFAFVNEIKSGGVNVAWKPTEQWSVNLDYHNSSGEGRPNSKNGASGSVAVASLNRITTTGYFSGNGMPVLERQLGERNSYNQIIRIDDLDVNDMQLSGSNFGTFKDRMDVEQAQLDAGFEFDGGHSINFGVSWIEVSNRHREMNIARDDWGGIGDPGAIADLLTIDTMAGAFDDLHGSGDPRQVSEFFTWDFDAMIKRGEELLQSGEHTNVIGLGGPCLTGFCPSYNFDTDQITKETSNAIYVQGHYLGDLLNRPYNLFVGARYEETDVHSEAYVPLYDDIMWSVLDGGLNFVEALDDDGNQISGFTELGGGYDVFLPSIDFDIEVMEDVILRASYSETITRPVYNDLRGGIQLNGLNKDVGFASSGNPRLLPMESDNYDLSVEWYYSEDSYASIGFWKKDVINFIANGTFEDERLFDDLHTPIDGPLYDQAVEEITGGDSTFEFDDEDLNTYYVENYDGQPGVVIMGEGDEAEAFVLGQSTDPVLLFDVSVPVNQRETGVKGWEIMLQHTFGESGFGMQANYTIVNGELEYDINLKEAQWVVPGMSDTANLVGFYDKNGIEVRITYNWRDEFLLDPAIDPKFVEEYYQWDANISYEVNDQLSLFAEGINITEENRRVHGRSKYQVREYAVGHARYNLGVRYVF
ncbi:Vitamin B12 transporter BtuB [Thalassocella blandensis]|nr:Vitamin B12 transporter BtuB [Thalassocella blandensis]